MPNINLDRLEDIANVPEAAEADEVGDIALLLLENQAVLKLRNIQNRRLYQNQVHADAEVKSITSRAKAAKIGYWVSWVILGSCILYLSSQLV